jgi:hypothetical protein
MGFATRALNWPAGFHCMIEKFVWMTPFLNNELIVFFNSSVVLMIAVINVPA